jgi:hypothetical protein
MLKSITGSPFAILSLFICDSVQKIPVSKWRIRLENSNKNTSYPAF